MSTLTAADQEFLNRLHLAIDARLGDEALGVPDLAEAMHMSRSNLLRRLKKITGQSINALIREKRMAHARTLLKTSTLNVSEVSGRVGFSSVSYFVKCYREHFGYPPGEEQLQPVPPTTPPDASEDDHPAVSDPVLPRAHDTHPRRKWALAFVGVVVVAALLWWVVRPKTTAGHATLAVLPFIFESTDSTGAYAINGLMEASLNQLQRARNLKVISRTTSMAISRTGKPLSALGHEFGIDYFLEGRGGRVGNVVQLHVSLVEAKTDHTLWSKQYKRQATDILGLQADIARDIYMEVYGAIGAITAAMDDTPPTSNREAYEDYLKGKEYRRKTQNEKNLTQALNFFSEAVRLDPNFALAHAEIAGLYYDADLFQAEKKFHDQIVTHAEKAYQLAPATSECLMAKALVYIHAGQYRVAVPYLEQALAINPNAVQVVNYLADIHYYYIPDTEKYLSYALMSVRLDAAAADSTTASNNYLRLGNALLQNGFFDEASQAVQRARDYNAHNIFIGHMAAWIRFFQTRDFDQCLSLLLEVVREDSTRIDVIQDVAKVYYMKGDYVRSLQYYRQFLDLRQRYRLEVYRQEELNIAEVLDKNGLQDEARFYRDRFKAFADADQTIYRPLYRMAYELSVGDGHQALAYLEEFSTHDSYVYWVLLMKNDPRFTQHPHHEAFDAVLSKIENNFWNKHRRLRMKLEEEGLL